MASYHPAVVGSSFRVFWQTQQACQCFSSSSFPLDCNWGRRRQSAGPKWTGRTVGSRMLLADYSRRVQIGSYLLQAVVHRVVDRNSKRSRNVEVRAEAQENVNREANNHEYYNALMRGGEVVTETLTEMTELLEDIAGFSKEEEEEAVRMAAAGAVGKKLDKLDASFMMALDWMIQQSEKEKDDKRQEILELIKETVLAQLSQKFPSHVQVVGALCTTSCRDARQEILRRCAGGGGVFKNEKGGEITLPRANLNEVANQADDIISDMEEKPLTADRRLLAKLLLIREEARSLLSGGLLDERNDNKGFENLPEVEVNFLSKLVALQPGPSLRERLAKVLRGKDEGEEKVTEDAEIRLRRRKFVNLGKEEKTTEVVNRPVRPGIFLQTVTKLLSGMYASNTAAGVTVQHLEWIHRVTLDILQEIAFS